VTPLEQALNETLLHFLWQGVIVGLLLWLALAFMQNTSPNIRYVVCCGALAILFLMPLVSLAAVYSSYASPGDATAPKIRFAGEPWQPNPLVPAIPPWLIGLKSWVSRVWAVGVVLCGIRLIWSWSYTRRLRSEGTEADSTATTMVSQVAAKLGLRRKVRLLMSTLADVPSAIGWLRPVLLIPAAAVVGLTPEQLGSVIAHELAHIRRHDYIVNVFQTLVEALLFYHPAVWWVSSRIRDERELCCDDVAVAYCGDAACYARALTLLEKQRTLRPSLAVGSAGGQLLYRIRRLLMSDPREYSPLRLVCGLALLTAVLGLALHIDAAESSQQPRNLNRSAAVFSASLIPGIQNARLPGAETVRPPSPAIPEEIRSSELRLEKPPIVDSVAQLALTLGTAALRSGQNSSPSQSREAIERAKADLEKAEELRRNASLEAAGELSARRAEMERLASQFRAKAEQQATEASQYNQIQRQFEELSKLRAEQQRQLESSVTKGPDEQTNVEAELRRALEEAKVQIRSMEAELASVRAELSRQRAANTGQARPGTDEILKNIESLQQELRAMMESVRGREIR